MAYRPQCEGLKELSMDGCTCTDDLYILISIRYSIVIQCLLLQKEI